VIYIGSSAGAIVCGKTAGIAFWKGWDSPEVTKNRGSFYFIYVLLL
jgi:peptidase E